LAAPIVAASSAWCFLCLPFLLFFLAAAFRGWLSLAVVAAFS